MIARVRVVFRKGIQVLTEIWVLRLRNIPSFLSAGSSRRGGCGGLRYNTMNEWARADRFVFNLFMSRREDLAQRLQDSLAQKVKAAVIQFHQDSPLDFLLRFASELFEESCPSSSLES